MSPYASILLFFIPFSAYAYIDPGSGSFVLQMLVASLIGVTFTIKAYFKNVKDFIRSLFSKSPSQTCDDKPKDENQSVQ